MKNSIKITDLSRIALGSALITICAWINIPTVIPFTLQTFAVFFVLSVLGGKNGTISITIYILLGLVGLPVFANFTAGISAILGSTGGYIIGFIFVGLEYWVITHFSGKKLLFEISSLIIGLATCYSFGTLWFVAFYTHECEDVCLSTTLTFCVIPFIIPDLIKLGLALTLSRRLSHILQS